MRRAVLQAEAMNFAPRLLTNHFVVIVYYIEDLLSHWHNRFPFPIFSLIAQTGQATPPRRALEPEVLSSQKRFQPSERAIFPSTTSPSSCAAAKNSVSPNRKTSPSLRPP